LTNYDLNLNGNLLSRREELYFVYDGPTFRDKMEMTSLISQLKSTEIVIKEIINNLYKEKNFSEPENVKIFLKLKKRSFQEIIEIVLNHPLLISVVGGCVVVLFNMLLNKKEKVKCSVNIENLSNNIVVVQHVNNIINPLKVDEDKFIFYSPKRKEIKTEIKFEEKNIINEKIKKLEQEVNVEMFKEDFFGYLYLINIDRRTFGFCLEGTKKHVPSTFINPIEIEDIREMLGEKLKIRARATFRNKVLSKLEIIEYEIKKRKNLNDFL
jgi:hypothetical protein